MQDTNKDEGKELIDMDENGNVKDKKEEKKNKSSEYYKYIISVILFLLLAFIFFFCFNTKGKRSAFDETKLKNLKLKNRFFFMVQNMIIIFRMENLMKKLLKKLKKEPKMMFPFLSQEEQ